MDPRDKKFNEDMVRLRNLTNNRKFPEAKKLYRQQWQAALKRFPAALRELTEIKAAISIEFNDYETFDEDMARLKKYGSAGYGAFLQARMMWGIGKHLTGLTMLEENYKVQWQHGQPVMPPDSPYHLCIPAEKSLIWNLLAQAYKFFLMPELAAGCYLRASESSKETEVQDYSNYLFCLHYLFVEKKKYFRQHLGYNRLFAEVKQMRHNIKDLKRRYGERKKIRVGYISPDFRFHVVLLFCWQMLTKYSKDEFEIYLFSNSGTCDQYGEYLKEHTDGWCCIYGMSADQAAAEVKKREIDILVELAGHSKDNCLPVLARKPAPIQICGIGYFATTGLKAVDYFLTDKYLVNEESQQYFTEKLLVQPHSHFCYVPRLYDKPVKGAACKEKGYITFGSFNNLAKVNDRVVDTWGRLMAQVPNSRLILKCNTLGDEDVKSLMAQRLEAVGITADRYDLRGFTLDYLVEYYEVDIALDTFPYPGGGTTCDALYMSVPVVTLGDGSHGGNFGVSLLKNIGLDYCCAGTVEEYIDKAVTLAGDYDLLDALHLGIRNMMEKSPVMDAKQYMADLETAYKRIWLEYLAKN